MTLLDPRADSKSSKSAGSSIIDHLKVYEVTFDAASVATIVAVEQDVTVPGVEVGDVVMGVENPALGVAVGVAGARVKSAGVIAVTFVNPTAGALNPDAGVYKFTVAKYRNL